MIDILGLPAACDHHAHQERSDGHGQSCVHGEQRHSERESDGGDGEDLVGDVVGYPVDDARNDSETDHDADDHESYDLDYQDDDRVEVHRSGCAAGVVGHQRRDDRQDDDLADILHDRDQDEHLDVLLVQAVLGFQDGHDHGGGRTGYDGTQHDGLGHVESQERSGDESAEDHERQLDHRYQYGEGTLLADLLDVDLQADAEHQHDQSHILQQRDDLLFGGYRLLVLVDEQDVDQDDPGDDVAYEGRELQFVEDDGADCGQQRE